MICSATWLQRESSQGPGVADTQSIWGMRSKNSSNRNGRLSKAEGSLKPYFTSSSFRILSPRYMAPIWGMVTWLSSMISRKSLGK